MEIEVSGISKILLKPGSKTEFGRGSGILSDDRTVSRHHVSFEVPLTTTSDVPKVRFEVIGRNPIWVLCSKNGKVDCFTSTQSGELEAGDKFCVSAKNPSWFTLRKAEFGGQIEDKCEKRQDFDENLVGLCELIDGEDLELESIDVSSIDPVKEFGFLVLGHEFDRYPKKMIRDMKDWDWFIEEPVIENDDNNEYEKRKKIRRGKRKKGDENDDEEWKVESEEETVQQVTKVQKVSKPKYTTRSKVCGNRSKEEAGKDLYLKQKSRATNHKVKDDDDEEDVTDEDDETLGGFIIDDELEQDGETDDNDDEDEEEFEEEDDEDE